MTDESFFIMIMGKMKCTAGRLQVFAERGCGICFLHEKLERKE